MTLDALQAGNLRRLTTATGNDMEPKWSPDGEWLAFHSDRDGDLDIWAMRLSGGEAMQLSSGPPSDRRPAWSPDGTAVAFTSDRAGNNDIWLLEAVTGASH